MIPELRALRAAIDAVILVIDRPDQKTSGPPVTAQAACTSRPAEGREEPGTISGGDDAYTNDAIAHLLGETNKWRVGAGYWINAAEILLERVQTAESAREAAEKRARDCERALSGSESCIESIRKALCNAGHCGDGGPLDELVTRALTESSARASVYARAELQPVIDAAAAELPNDDGDLGTLAERVRRVVKRAAEFRGLLKRALPSVDAIAVGAGNVELRQDIRAALSPPDLDSLAELRAWRQASEG